jgi:hypothetical protein
MLTIFGIVAAISLAASIIHYFRKEMAHARSVLANARKEFGS